MKIVFAIFLLFLAAPVEAATRYASTGGGGSAPCTSDSAPQCSLATAIGQMVAGDTLYLHGGTYASTINITAITGGSSSVVTTIAGYPGETAIIKPINSVNGIEGIGCAIATCPTLKYFTFQHLTLDGGNQTSEQFGISINIQGITWDDIDYTGWTGSILVSSDDLIVKNSRIHDLRCLSCIPGDRTLGIYDHHGANHLWQNNEIYNNPGGGGQIYPGSTTGDSTSHSGSIVFERNYVHDNAYLVGPLGNVGGLTLSTNAAITVRSNIFANNRNTGGTARCIWAAGGSGAHLIYNNTCYNGNIGFQTDIAGVQIINNVSIDNDAGQNILDAGSGTVRHHNFCTSGCTNTSGGTGTINSATDPFINATGGNFHPRSGSPLIDAGANLTASVPTDFSGAAWALPMEIGAYAFISAPSCPAVSPALVANYSFEGSGVDITGNGHTATLGSGWSYTASGKTGQGALSNGTSGITVADHDALDPCAGFTYEGWINLPNTTGDYVFINKNPDSKAFLFASIYGFCGSGVPIGGYSDLTSPVACSTTALTPGFKHLAITYDATLPSANVKLYQNGVQVSSADGTNLLTPTTGSLQFCGSSFGEICPSGTIIDEIRIYNYARSASEILSSVTAPPVFTIKLQISSIKIGPSVSLKVGVP